MWHIYVIGFVMGLTAAAVPGPINLEVVRRALSRGTILGLAFGMGAVTADIIFTIAMTYGASTLVNSLSRNGKALMWLFGSVCLLFVGFTAFRAKMPEQKPLPKIGETQEIGTIELAHPVVGLQRILKYYFVALFLTLSSPATIMYWVASSIGFSKFTSDPAEVDQPDYVPYVLAAGVGIACTLWVVMVATIAGKFHRRIQPRTYLLVEHAGGLALCGFAAFSFYKAIRILMGH
jgi:threonine/homoserine/homoserine lactone efflux protein